GKYHWFAVTNAGETHDHLSEPKGDTVDSIYNGLQDGKPLKEVIKMIFSDGAKALEVRSETFIDGKSASVLQVSGRKSGPGEARRRTGRGSKRCARCCLARRRVIEPRPRCGSSSPSSGARAPPTASSSSTRSPRSCRRRPRESRSWCCSTICTRPTRRRCCSP